MPFVFVAILLVCEVHSFGQTKVVNFESLPVPLTGFFNGDTSGSSPYRDNFRVVGSRNNFGSTETLQLWGIDKVELFNGFTPAFGSFNGWSWSNVVDTSTPGFTNQFASYPGGGSDGSGGVDSGSTYAVGFGNDSYINFGSGIGLQSIEIANTTYSALSMRDGDSFTDPFGGGSGNEEDYFRVLVTGYDQWFSGVNQSGSAIGSVELYLADYRFSDNSQDFINDQWNLLDLSPIQNARSIQINFDVSDNFIPTYVAIDNLTYSIPEPSHFLLLTAPIFGMIRRRRK